MKEMDTLPPQFDAYRRWALIVGVAGLAVCAAGAVWNPDQFLRSYLVGFIFCLAFPVGCLSILMLHNLTGGWWGLPVRRALEAGSRTFPLLALFFIPILIGLRRLYGWARPGSLPASNFQRVYLSPHFFMGRTVFYFAVWLVLAFALDRMSKRHDETGDPALLPRMEAVSGPGLVFLGLTVTFSSVDWVMSLERGWFSTIYGMIFIIVNALTAMAFVILVARQLAGSKPFSKLFQPSEFNDLGNLLLAFVMLLAYLSFSQFLIIWAGNLKEEIPWYISRARGGWGELAFGLAVFHFFVPFFLLLSRDVKRRPGALSVVAGLLIVASLLNIFWLIVPSFWPAAPRVVWMDAAAPVGLLGLWVWRFIGELRRRPLLPLKHPYFEGAVEHAD